MGLEIQLNNTSYPIISGICFTVKGYSANQDIRKPYLGVNIGFDERPTVKLTAILDTNLEVEELLYVWKHEMDEGQGIFMTQTEIFGKNDMYGLRQISPIIHTKPNGVNTITLGCEVVFDSLDATNNLPTVEDITIHVRKNSSDNFVILRGDDIDGDTLTFEQQVGVGFGTLKGVGSNLYYTPDPDVVGTDCFSYIARDYFGASQTGVVTIIIDEASMSDTVIEYSVTAPLHVTGNYYYDLGDDNWHRGTGGFLTSISGKILIRSHDSQVSNPEVVTGVTMMEWGTRTDFRGLCAGSKTITSFAIDDDAGVCIGNKFKEMFKGSGIDSFQTFDTSLGDDFYGFIEDSDVVSIPALDFSNGTDFRYMTSNTPYLSAIGVLDTPKGKYFDYMFYKTPQATCLGGINTLNKISTTNMFEDSGFVTPDTAAQGQILNGDLYVSASPCLLEILSITHIGGSESCHLLLPSDECKSEGTYKINLHGAAPAGTTYKWEVKDGTITSGGTTDTVTVESTMSNHDVKVQVQCEITYSGATNVSGYVSFTHSRTAEFLILTLPKAYKTIDLRAYIDANNPTNKTDILVHNRVENIHVKSGDLSGLTVELHNSGELIGERVATRRDANITSNTGLSLTSNLKLINTGTIAGAGGWGGKGGKAGTIPAESGETLTYDSGWLSALYSGYKVTRGFVSGELKYPSGATRTDLRWEGNTIKNWTGGILNSYTIEKGSDKYEHWQPNFTTRVHKGPYGDFLTRVIYGVRIKHYQRYSNSAIIGGEGGLGGTGAGYNYTRTGGLGGASSIPSGGYRGGRGGAGAGIGVDGYKGEPGAHGAAGTNGYKAGKAIYGVSFLVAGSIQGRLLGGTA